MAVVRARTSPPYALIIFVILWVISTGLAVFLFTQQSQLKLDRQKADDELARVMKSGERGQVQQFIAEGNPGGGARGGVSAIAEASKQIADLRSAISGGANDSTSAVLASAKQTAEGAGAPNLVAAVKVLQASTEANKGQIEGLKRQLTQATETNESQRRRLEEDRKKGEETIDRLKADLQAAQAGRKTEEERANTVQEAGKKVADDLQKRLDETIKAHDVEMANARQTIKQQEQTIATLRAIIEGLRPRGSGRVAAVANGNIIRTSPVANEVYINLGRADKVVPGLTFSVHDPRIGIQTEGGRERGKGGIEVIEVGERESLARITSSEKNQRIQPGDLLYNLVFSNDKTRKLHFVVYGDFDIDGDGQATSLEREKIVRMIDEWGGKVDSLGQVEERDPKTGETIKLASLSPQTDYLVLGLPPKVPQGVKPDDMDEASKGVFEAAVKRQREFDRIESEAKRASVPILNANRFLNLIGYYNTTLIRR